MILLLNLLASFISLRMAISPLEVLPVFERRHLKSDGTLA